MTPKQLLVEFYQYPLQLRIAARLHLDGYTELTLIVDLGLTDPAANQVINYVRDIETGHRQIDKRLEELARTL